LTKKNDKDANWEFIQEVALKARPKSKHPICDCMANAAGDLDPEALVIPLDVARQMEYNWKYYEKKVLS